MRRLISILSTLAAMWMIAATAMAADNPPLGYYRWPTAFGDKVVFSSEGDLWVAPLAGGMARRLTTAAGTESFAMFSPDGKWIAFSGSYDGNLDVYVIPAEGGEPKRLTFNPAADFVAGWTPDGKVLFRSMMESGQYIWKCFTVPVTGGFPEKVAVDEAAHLSYEPHGDRIAYTRVSLGTRTWKRYKGGWAEQIMVGSLKTHDYKQVTTWEGNNAIPMWYGDRIYYLRDHDSRVNIHSMKPDGSDIQQHTFHNDWDARWASLSSDGKISYSLGADIWVYDIAKNETHKIDITLPSDRIQTRDRFVSPDDYTGEFALNNDGKRLLVGARGDLFSASTEKRSVIRQITRTPDAREKGSNFTPSGDSILTWSDITGEEALYLYSAKGNGGSRKLADGKAGWNFEPDISPDGKWAVYGDCKRNLNLVDMKTGETSSIDTSYWEMREYSWSPDSKYIAYSVAMPNGNSVIRIYDLAAKSVHVVTDEMWSSGSPTWDPKGKWLYFVSSRFMNPHNNTLDWSFIVEEPDRLYGLALDKDTKSPYQYDDDVAVKKDDKDKDKDKDKKDEGDKDAKGKDKDKDKDKEKKEKVEVKIDWAGLADRIIELPVDAGNYTGLTAMEGKIYYIGYPSQGWRDGDADPGERGSRATLHLFDVAKKKDHAVSKAIMGYSLSKDLKKIAVRKKSGFVIMDAGAGKEPEEDKDEDKDAGLHLDDWFYDVSPRLEWKQIFNEAWRLERDFFYDANMHGVDWKGMKEHYRSLLPRVGTRDELTDIIAELISELNIGHTYVGGGDAVGPKRVGVGLLGVDVSKDGSGFYKIEKILAGDRWDKDNTSPLGAPGLNIKTGDYVVAIDHTPTNSVQNYQELLVNKAGKLVLVSTNDKPSLDGAKDVVVKTLGGEFKLRYWDWVYGRAEYVKKKAGDAIGYVHLSDMGGDGLEEWMREYYPQSQKKMLIMDVRYNGGGNIAEWILSELQRTVWTWGTSRNGQRYHRPGSAFYGYMIALCNEETGSDGETFSEGWKRLKLGPLVGKRTWGGWVGIRGDKPLLDRGYLTQPEFTGWGKEGTWLIEGPGVSPDTEVNNHPKQMMEGVDEQLDYAIKYLQDKMKSDPIADPPRPAFPIKKATGTDVKK